MSEVNASPVVVERAYRVRLKLTRRQVHLLHRLFGSARHVWNWALETRSSAYRERGEKLNWVALSSLYTQYRQAPGTGWLATLPREPFKQVLRDQERAFQNFFAKRAKYPRFRRRGEHQAVRFTLDQRRVQVDRTGGTVSLPGLGRVRFKNTYADMPGRLRSVTLSRDAGGRYFASFTADQVPAPVLLPAPVPAVGVDLGLHRLATLSTGEVIEAPKTLANHLLRLARYQRHMIRQRNAAMRSVGLDPAKPIPKGTRLPVSNRQRRTRARIGRLHARIGDLRRNTQHQLTTHLMRQFNTVCLEDLSVKGMSRSMGRRSFRRSVSDAALGEVNRQISYKAHWYGRAVVHVDRWYPSSQICSGCGERNAGLKLSDRSWRCKSCGTEHDRDLNAATNILHEGLRIVSSTPRSGGIHARGETEVRELAQANSTRLHSLNREPVKRRLAPSQRASRRERRRTGT